MKLNILKNNIISMIQKEISTESELLKVVKEKQKFKTIDSRLAESNVISIEKIINDKFLIVDKRNGKISEVIKLYLIKNISGEWTIDYLKELYVQK